MVKKLLLVIFFLVIAVAAQAAVQCPSGTFALQTQPLKCDATTFTPPAHIATVNGSWRINNPNANSSRDLEIFNNVLGSAEIVFDKTSLGTQDWILFTNGSANGGRQMIFESFISPFAGFALVDGNDTVTPNTMFVTQEFTPTPTTFSTLATCSAGEDGAIARITDAPTNNLGDAITVGAGGNTVDIMCSHTSSDHYLVIATNAVNLNFPPGALSTCGSCAAAIEGRYCTETNSLGACSLGATATTGGTTHCAIRCNGTNWIQTGL